MDSRTRNIIIIAAIIVIVLVGVWFLVARNDDDSETAVSENTNVPSESTPSATPESSSEITITITDAGFSPTSAAIKSGGTITWVNNSSRDVQIGANPHPEHTGNREVSGGEYTLVVAPGQQKSITVEKTGTFGFHNHLNSSQEATVIVE